MNPHEKLAMEFFSPPGPSAREWICRSADIPRWMDGAQSWPKWLRRDEYEIRLKPQTITLPERTIPKPLDVGELVEWERCCVAAPGDPNWAYGIRFDPQNLEHQSLAKRGFCYPHTAQGEADAIAAAKGMIGRDEG